MKQVININFQGRVVPIEQTAYDVLKEYIDSLNRFFAAEEGREEIVNDIENRIGELFQQKLQDGTSCITDDDVEAVIKSIGRPQDFEEQEMGGTTTGATASAGATGATEERTRPIFSKGNRLYRDENDKVLGGVCSGLSHYFNVDVVVVRIIFAILFFSFGIGLIPYIILWVVVPSTATQQIGSVRKRLFRDTENKYVGGVCSGIANYFGIKSWIPRLIFFIPLMSFVSKWNWGNWDLFDGFRIGFSPSALIIYIILWLVIPEAKTTSEKLEMKGEKVDIDSIKNSVKEEFRGVQQRATKFGNEAREALGGTYGATASGDTVRRTGNGIGRFISLLVKIILYTIAGSLLIGLLVGLFALAIISIGIFPLKDYILSGTWQNLYAWGTLIFFIAVPIIGLITWLVRKFAKIKSNGAYMRGGFIGLWVIGWICATLLVTSVSRELRVANRPQPQEIYLNNPRVNKLELTTSSTDFQYNVPRTFTLRPFDWMDEDTAIVRNIHINLLKAKGDSFRVVMYKAARGNSREKADANADLFDFNISQVDSMLVLDKGIKINKTDKFRNQEVIINVYVPVGKQIKLNRNTDNWSSVRLEVLGSGYYEDRNFENILKGWSWDTDYIMKEDGLYTLDGLPANTRKLRERYQKAGVNIDEGGIRIETKDGKKVTIDENGIIIKDVDDNDGSYRYQSEADTIKKQTEQKKIEDQKLIDARERKKDSLRKELQKLEKEPGATASIRFSIPGYNPALWL